METNELSINVLEDKSIGELKYKPSIIMTESPEYNVEYDVFGLSSYIYNILDKIILTEFEHVFKDKHDIKINQRTITYKKGSIDLLEDLINFLSSFNLLSESLNYFKEYVFQRPFNIVIDDDMELMMIWYKEDNSMCTLTFTSNKKIIFASSEDEYPPYTSNLTPNAIRDFCDFVYKFE